jgi:alkanesulfonate monooxygenase
MSVEFIGYVGHFNSSETMRRTTGAIDPGHIEAVAKAHEHVGFDRVLVAFNSNSAESILVGQHIASVTERLGLMIAHRPGFTAPTLAARQLATLDQLSKGRAAVHIITGGNDTELAQDGDHLTKDERYARTREYLDVVRQEWTASTPFDYDGKYYQVRRGFGDVKPYAPTGIPVYFGGASEAAIPVAGKHADVYALWGETHDQVRSLVARIRAAAAPFGRAPRFSLSLRPVLADTEEKAWAKADDILARATALRAAGGTGRAPHNARDGVTTPPNEGSRRLLAAAAQGTRLDKRLWTGIAALTGAQGNSTGLVGTPDQVADAMLDYVDLGISTFLIRGFDPLVDAVQYGRDLIPRVRDLLAARGGVAVAAE